MLTIRNDSLLHTIGLFPPAAPHPPAPAHGAGPLGLPGGDIFEDVAKPAGTGLKPLGHGGGDAFEDAKKLPPAGPGLKPLDSRGAGSSDAADAEARAKIKKLMKDYDPEDDDADEIAEKIAKDPELLANLTKKERLKLIEGLFDGDTGEGEEDAALKILLSAESSDELQWLVKKLGWSELKDELDPGDIDRISKELASRKDAEGSHVEQHLEIVADKPVTKDTKMQELTDLVNKKLDGMSAKEIGALADGLLADREPILAEIASQRRRGKTPKAAELELVLNLVAARLPEPQRTAMRSFAWEVHYTDDIATELAEGDYAQLLRMLPAMADPNLPPEQRTALFESLRKLRPEIDAMEAVVNLRGDPVEKERLRVFMNAFEAFMDNFNPNVPATTVLQDVLAALGATVEDIKQGFESLESTVGNMADQIKGTVTLANFLGSADDTDAEFLIRELMSKETPDANLLASIPFDVKVQLLKALVSPFCEDEEEQAILHLLRETKEKDPSEYYQLISAVGFENFDSAIDGDEWDDFMALLES